MKHAVTIGCGSGNGRVIIDTLQERGFDVINLGQNSHPDCRNIPVSWNDLDMTTLHKLYRPNGTMVDFLFFNHNASSLDHTVFDTTRDALQVWRLLKDWQHTHWLSCQMPVLMIHYLRKYLHPHSKIGWMLSTMMRHDRENTEQYPDYSSQKYFSYQAVKGFSRFYETFGILPDFDLPGAHQQLKTFVNDVCDHEVKAKIFQMQKS